MSTPSNSRQWRGNNYRPTGPFRYPVLGDGRDGWRTRHGGSVIQWSCRGPKTMTPDQVARDLLHANGDRWKGLPGAALDDVRVERLNRRVPAPAGQDRRPRSQWLPSATVRVFASTALCTAILEGAVVGYSFRPARPFERAPIRCYRCGEMGFHVGKFCRNKPRCRHCGKGHETSHCPDRQHDHPLGNTAGGPPQGAAQTL